MSLDLLNIAIPIGFILVVFAIAGVIRIVCGPGMPITGDDDPEIGD